MLHQVRLVMSNYFEEQTFEGESLEQEEISAGEYELCVFRNCDFSQGNLSGFSFLECEFIECNFSNANLSDVSLQSARFTNCKMLGLHFYKAKSFGFEAHFEQCQLDHSIFYQMNLGSCSFNACQLKGADFSEAGMKGVSLTNCNLQNAIFDRTNLERADLRATINYMIDPEINRLQGAQFDMPGVLGLLAKYKIKVSQFELKLNTFLRKLYRKAK